MGEERDGPWYRQSCFERNLNVFTRNLKKLKKKTFLWWDHSLSHVWTSGAVMWSVGPEGQKRSKRVVTPIPNCSLRNSSGRLRVSLRIFPSLFISACDFLLKTSAGLLAKPLALKSRVVYHSMFSSKSLGAWSLGGHLAQLSCLG